MKLKRRNERNAVTKSFVELTDNDADADSTAPVTSLAVRLASSALGAHQSRKRRARATYTAAVEGATARSWSKNRSKQASKASLGEAAAGSTRGRSTPRSARTSSIWLSARREQTRPPSRRRGSSPRNSSSRSLLRSAALSWRSSSHRLRRATCLSSEVTERAE
jgi:hypothetical protein